MSTARKNILKHVANNLMYMIYTGVIFMLLLTMQACGNDNNNDVEQPQDQNHNMTMDMKGVSEGLINNASLYVFDYNADLPSSAFLRKQVGVTRVGDILKTQMVEGNYNLVLISCEDNSLADVKYPQDPTKKMDAPMWVLGNNGSFLKDMPELRYGQMQNVRIDEGLTTNETASLDRNVAKVRIILEGFEGFDPVANQIGKAYFELHDVPTTLSWEGRLLPSGTNPTVSTVPMRKYMVFEGSTVKTTEFLIPAHRARDLSDLATNKIRIKGCMILGGNEFYGKSVDPITQIPIQINFVPQPNKIIEITIKKFSGEPDTKLDIKVTVKDWGTVEQGVTFE